MTLRMKYVGNTPDETYPAATEYIVARDGDLTLKDADGHRVATVSRGQWVRVTGEE